MSNLPRILQLTLRQGNVYKMPHRGLSSPLPHYFIVLTPEPTSTEVLILGVFTSKVDKVKKMRQREPSSTLVEISPNEYSELSLESVVDCNSPLKMAINTFVENHNTQQIENCDVLSEELLEKILYGVQESRLVAQNIKDLLK